MASLSFERSARGYDVAYGAGDQVSSMRGFCQPCADGPGDAVRLVDGECGRCHWFDWDDAPGSKDACCCCGSARGCDCHAAGGHGDEDEEDASSVATLAYEEINGVVIVTLPDGRKVLSGNTFAFREQIKAASRAAGLAAGWDPAEKTWTVSAGSDLSFLRPPPPAPKKRRLPFRGACCADARHEIDPDCPQGPMLILCDACGTRRRDSWEGS